MIYGGLTTATGVIALGNVGFAYYSLSSAGPYEYHWEGRVVMFQGDHLDQSGSGDGVDFVISGYQLFLP